ncbi:MAG: ADP-dependent NAD(P)H-hydrate dehydratase [Gulosibacter sp.]|uniref:ADP-dependent NAD(P)H-hydrate dehydratase n=1 Tax=Gulosibacter sp. TaxID=2817531 RepID=UPI003F937857
MSTDTNASWQELSVQQLRSSVRAPGPEDDKYSRGVVMLATGSQMYPGAAVLSAQAAGHSGAGMIRYTGPEKVAELVLSTRPEVVRGLGRCNALVIGSGVPDIREDERRSLMPSKAKAKYPTVVDAGALTLLEPGQRDTIITPHAGELSNLLERLEIARLSRQEIEADPGASARLAARELGCTVLLKGRVTHVVQGETQLRITALNSWLATAGTGDVLAGILGTLLAARHARGEVADHATDAAAAAWLHSRAGWLASQRNAGHNPDPFQLLATDKSFRREPIGAPILASHVAEAMPAVIASVLAG